MDNVYHGSIINASQKNSSIFKELCVLGCKKRYFGLIRIYKVEVPEDKIKEVIKRIQENMSDHMGILSKEWYVHFYRSEELIVVFRHKVFYVSSDKDSWGETIAYGISLNIPKKQLDFFPYHFEDELW